MEALSPLPHIPSQNSELMMIVFLSSILQSLPLFSLKTSISRANASKALLTSIYL